VRIRTAIAVVAVLALAVTVGAVVAVHQLGRNLNLRLPRQACEVATGSGATVSLDPDQMANAATVAAVGISGGVPEQGIVVALATALQESKLHNLDAGDRDSIGLFQQRPSQGWGTADQIADPRYSAGEFYAALRKVPGWESMRVTDAAQAVQRSAHPEAYDKWTDESTSIADAMLGTTTSAVTCALTDRPAQRGPAAADALAADLRGDWGDRIAPVADANLPGLSVPAADVRSGWRYAHWLVAHAKVSGVKRVRYDDREWTAEAGAWSKLPSGQPDRSAVLAEVYGDA
jgi:hypothetical protein